MITEDYVSFEIAKLLREKGFCENTEHKIWYVIKQFSTGCHWNSCTHKVGDITREYNDDCCIPMPTLQMTMKWLREVHHLYIQVMRDSWACDEHMGYYIVIQNTTSDFEIMLQDFVDDVFYDTYEDACKAAIKYCLENLI